MQIAITACLIAGAYLLGAVPFALALGLARGTDIRRIGSGNIGATNLARALGRKWGVLAFLLDFAKGLLPVIAARLLAARFPELLALEATWIPLLAGVAAILGHVFPVYLGFRGGKGVATTFGVMTALSWSASLAGGAVWALVYLLTRTVSIASMAAALALPLGVLLLDRSPAGTAYLTVQIFSVAVCGLILVRHRSNLERLFKGRELSFHKPDKV